MAKNPSISTRIDTEPLRNRIAAIDDPTTALLVMALCDFVDANQPGLALLDQMFGPIRMSAAGWGVTDIALEHHAMEPARMRVELIHIGPRT